MAQPTYSRNQWATALVKTLVGNLAGAHVPPESVAFVIGWTVAEYSQAESKKAPYNCLNMTNGGDIAAFHPHVVFSNGIVAFDRFADGIAATAERLSNSPLYQGVQIALVNEPANLAIHDVNGNLLVTTPYSPGEGVKKSLAAWVNGPNGGPVSQSYLDNIAKGITAGGDLLFGVSGDTTISTDTTGIFQESNTSGNGPSISATQIIKVLGGALMILAGIALLLKSFNPVLVGRGR